MSGRIASPLSAPSQASSFLVANSRWFGTAVLANYFHFSASHVRPGPPLRCPGDSWPSDGPAPASRAARGRRWISHRSQTAVWVYGVICVPRRRDQIVQHRPDASSTTPLCLRISISGPRKAPLAARDQVVDPPVAIAAAAPDIERRVLVALADGALHVGGPVPRRQKDIRPVRVRIAAISDSTPSTARGFPSSLLLK